MVQLRHVLRHRVRPHPQQVLLHGHATREAAVGGVEEVLGDVASAGVERLPAWKYASLKLCSVPMSTIRAGKS